MRSSLKEQFERLVEAKDAGQGRSATPEDAPNAEPWILRGRPEGVPQTVTVARALVAFGGVSLRRAHRIISDLAATYADEAKRDQGVAVFLAPRDHVALIERLAALNVDAELRSTPDVGVKAIREALGLSQSEFAARFGLRLKTVQNWEQGRSRPDEPARVLLRVIQREAEAVDRALARVGSIRSYS
jgi:DNA-binding transcriptional regulator YiaG